MLNEPWIGRILDAFWEAAGGREPFPRDLEEPVLWALPLAIVKIPRLCVRDVESWLVHQAISLRLSCQDRPLRGCLIAHAGRGFVLLDGTDPEDERRVSLAHETAHFLVDYLHPRTEAIRRLGPQIEEVLDGQRRATIAERVDAVLSEITLGVHTHLMDRADDGLYADGRILAAESRADRVSLQLLAPEAEVRKQVQQETQPASYREGTPRLAEVLQREFGLPERVAQSYGKALAWEWYGAPPVRGWLGIR